MSLPTSFLWLLYRTPLLVTYHLWVPNIDTNWFLRRNKQSELAGKTLSWTHRRTMEPLSQVKSYFTINTSNKCNDSKSLMGLLEAAKRLKPWAILKTSSADCFADCLAGVIPKKEAGNTQTRYDYKKPPMLCFAVLSVYACTCGYVDIEIVLPICSQRLMPQSTWISWKVTAVTMPFQSAVNWSFLIPNFK